MAKFLFPANPTDGMIVEIVPGMVYQFDAGTRSWYLVNKNTYQVASILEAGLMSKVDYAKINDLIVPIPQSTLQAGDCQLKFDKGTIGLFSNDESMTIDNQLKVGNSGQSVVKAWGVNDHTVGFNFKLNLDMLLKEADRRGNIVRKQIRGVQGLKGQKGDSGVDELDTGPIGNTGQDGKNSVFTGSLVSEPIKLDDDTSKAIVDISTEEVSESENYLVITRAAIGDPTACPNSISPRDFSSQWLVAVKQGNSKILRRSESVSSTDCALVCTVCSSSIYYLNIVNIVNDIASRYKYLLSQLKSHKESMVQSWLRTMIAMFNDQKAALCCALENCRSRYRNQNERRYLEQSRLQAVLSGNTIVVGDEADHNVVDMNEGRHCPVSEQDDSNVVFGDCSRGECTVQVILDGKLNSVDPRITPGSSVKFVLPAGQYNAEITQCCIATGSIISPGNTGTSKSPKNVLLNTTKPPVIAAPAHIAGLSDDTVSTGNAALTVSPFIIAAQPSLHQVNIPLLVSVPDATRAATNGIVNGLANTSVFRSLAGRVAFTDYIKANQDELKRLCIPNDTAAKLGRRLEIFEEAVRLGKNADVASTGVLLFLFKPGTVGYDAYQAYLNNNNVVNIPIGQARSLAYDKANRVGLAAEAFDIILPFHPRTRISVGGYTGRIAILSNILFGAASSIAKKVSTSVDFGMYQDESAAKNVYLGSNISFDHVGGDVEVWIIDKDGNPNNNSGQITVCIKETSCVPNADLSAEGTDFSDYIFLYREEISVDSYVGPIQQFTGNKSNADNYVISGDNGTLINGPVLETRKVKVFLYENAGDLSLYVLGNSSGGLFSTTTPIIMDFTFQGLRATPVIVDGLSTSVVLSGTDSYHAEWNVSNDTFGVVFSLTNIQTDWSIIIDPTDLDGITTFEVDGTGVNDICTNANGVGKIVRGLNGSSGDLIEVINTVPVGQFASNVGYNRPTGMAVSNRKHGQSMTITRTFKNLPTADVDMSLDIASVHFGLNTIEPIVLEVRLIHSDGGIYTFNQPTSQSNLDTWEFREYSGVKNFVAGSTNTNLINIKDLVKLELYIADAPASQPLFSIAPIYAKLSNGRFVLLDNFDYEKIVQYGESWNYGYLPRDNSDNHFPFPWSGLNGQIASSPAVAAVDEPGKFTNIYGSSNSAYWPVRVYGAQLPYGQGVLAPINLKYNELPSVQYDSCQGKQARLPFQGPSLGLLAAKTVFIDVNQSKLSIICSAGQEIAAVAVNGTIISINGLITYIPNCASRLVQYDIPDSLIKIGDFNTIGVLSRAVKVSPAAYLDIFVTCTADNTTVLRNYWTVDAVNVVSNALNRIILSTTPPGGGCAYPASKVMWLLRGHRIGAACSCFVEVDGASYIIAKRSLGIDMSCGGGESTLNSCVSQYLASVGDYPAIAWQSIDGIEGLGVPNSGDVSFVEDQALSDKIMAKIRNGDITNVSGDPLNNISFVIFPVLNKNTSSYTVSTLTPTTTAATYDSMILSTSNVEYYWPMDELSGTTMYELVQAASGVWSSVILGQAGPFTDTNKRAPYFDTIGYGTLPQFGWSHSQGSVEFWYRSSAAADEGIFEYGDYSNPTEDYISFRHESSVFVITIYQNGSTSGDYNADTIGNDGIWHHVVHTWDGVNRITYFDGVQVSSVASTMTPTWTLGDVSSRVVGGNFMAYDALNGNVCALALYSVALSPATILNHYNNR